MTLQFLFGNLFPNNLTIDKGDYAEMVFNAMTPYTTPIGFILVVCGGIMGVIHWRKFRKAAGYAVRVRGLRNANPGNAVLEAMNTGAFAEAGRLSRQSILPWGYIIFMVGKLTILSPFAVAQLIIAHYP